MTGRTYLPEMGGEPFGGKTYTHPDVFTLGVAEGWAEAEADPTRIDWTERQARAAIPFDVIGGRPVNPCEKTGVTRGRNEMGFWGEQQMADALVAVTLCGTRYLLMIERGDGYGWAVPGGHVEPGEPAMFAAIRELAEETGLALFGGETFLTLETFRALAPRYVPDPRASDEAWAVTIPVRIDLGTRGTLPAVTGGDDARRAEWVPARQLRLPRRCARRPVRGHGLRQRGDCQLNLVREPRHYGQKQRGCDDCQADQDVDTSCQTSETS